MRRLVLIGGGHTHALVLQKWAANPLPNTQLTLINPNETAPYTGMLPGFIAGHYTREALEIDLVKLTERANAQLVLGYAVGIDVAQKRVQISGHADVFYDSLSIDIGITTELNNISGAADHAVSAKPLGAFAQAWTDFLAQAKAETMTPKIAVIGGGVAGVELALAMAHRFHAEGLGTPQIRLIEAETEILREIGPSARRVLERELSHYGINIMTGLHVNNITQDAVSFDSGAPSIPANFVVTAAGASAHSWLKDTSLALHNGYINVDAALRSTNTPDVFAAGDCAHLSFAPRPKAGVFAVREAPILYQNLRAEPSLQKMAQFKPQKSYLKLISTGRTSAIADKWGLTPRGHWVWRIKNHIDQSFMKKFRL